MFKIFKRGESAEHVPTEEEGMESFLESQLDRNLLQLWCERCVENRMAEDLNLQYANLQRISFTRVSQVMLSLQYEVEYIKAYIAVYQKMPMEEFYVNFVSKWTGSEIFVPPFILIPLIQNSLVYGYCRMERFPVKIKLSGSEKMLTLEVSNRVNHHIPDQRTTAIIQAYKKRLNLIYPKRYQLLFNSNSNTFKASLTLEL